MPDVEGNAESSADEGHPLAITHGNQVHKIMKSFSLNLNCQLTNLGTGIMKGWLGPHTNLRHSREV